MSDRVEKIKEMLSASPADNFLQHALALEYVKVGDDVTARGLFEEILTRDPDYIGSYYHLAKLLERTGEPQLAIQWYKKGIEKAEVLRENRTLSELRGALDELVY